MSKERVADRILKLWLKERKKKKKESGNSPKKTVDLNEQSKET